MPRTARIVAPNVPHHITQRGNRRQPVFFGDDDYRLYLELMAEWCGKCGVEIWAYCLMENHIHLIAVPPAEDSLARAIGEAHRRYTAEVNRREGWTGHLWQGRFASFAMDEGYTMQAARYVERGPVEAKICRSPWRYEWSSAQAHVEAADDILVKVAPLLERVEGDWKDFLKKDPADDFGERLESQSAGGWPLGSAEFIENLERKAGKPMKPRPRGRPVKQIERSGNV